MSAYKVIAKSAKETQKNAKKLASQVVKHRKLNEKRAVVLALEGELGAGKTTFVQGFARALGAKENVLSPTFVLLKVYPLKSIKFKRFKHLVHIDCYRLGSPRELLHLGFRDLLKSEDAIILIEWADKVRKLIPRGAIWVRFGHGRGSRERVLKVLNPKS